jgi:hypothetical protein
VDLVTELLVEVHRIQVLSLIRRDAYMLITPGGLERLGSRLRIETDECWPLLTELIDEGFIAPLPPGLKRYWTPLRLTPLGEGYLEWMRRRLLMGSDPGSGPTGPLATMH